ncbi:MAG: DUF4861 family protein [Paludibacteraceae bacterium]|nr:DUF4861 family protein [Paludibacteraceae bacterium]
MKRMILSLMVVFALLSCDKGQQITISNTSDSPRQGELVELSLSMLEWEEASSYRLLDEQGNEVPYQVMSYGEAVAQSILFPATVDAQSNVVYVLKKGTPASYAPKTSARYVPERKDDFAWENDKAAYRMYGPALAAENPSCGVDLWLKRTEELVVDTFYYNELTLGQSYHVDHGKGLDCYKVANKLGAGGVVPLYNDTLWVGTHYDRYEVLEQGGLRSVFALEYDSVRVGDAYYTQRIVITCDAGALLNKAVVSYQGEQLKGMKVAAGIWLHATVDNYKQDLKGNWIAYAENAVSDAGIPVGRNYISVVMPEMEGAQVIDQTLIAYRSYTTGTPLTYYFGGGWSQWGYPTDDEWFAATAEAAANLATPLTVTVIP